MPGVVQHTIESLCKAAYDAGSAGVGGLMLFGVPMSKDAVGSAGTDPDGILQQALRAVVAEVGDETVVMSDLCWTSTPTRALRRPAPDGSVDNDATLSRYAEMAVRAGVGGRSPRRSERDDGRPGGCGCAGPLMRRA